MKNVFCLHQLDLLPSLDQNPYHHHHHHRVTGTSPIGFSPVGRSPLAEIQRYIGETPLHFRQLAKFQRTRWRKYDGLSPVVTDQY
jgi:hypothetical protein